MTADLITKSDRLVTELNKMRIDLQSHHDKLRQLTSQNSENEAVRTEFEKLEEDGHIWKLTGPLMVRQDKEEAKANVDKRLEFITSELTKVEEAIKRCEEDFEKKRQELITVQTEFQRSSAVAAK